MVRDKARPEPLRRCFVIAPIGDDGSDDRKRLDKLLRHIIRPAAKRCGYDAIPANEIQKPGIVTTQVIDELLDAPLVIADLTNHNANVLYELAIRHVTKEAVVQIIHKGQPLPFDVCTSRTISYSFDIDDVAKALKDLVCQIRAVEKDGGAVDSPIKAAVNAKALRAVGNPDGNMLAHISAQLAELQQGPRHGYIPLGGENWTPQSTRRTPYDDEVPGFLCPECGDLSRNPYTCTSCGAGNGEP